MDKEIKAAAVAADPVPRFRRKLIDDGLATEQELAEMEAEIEAALDRAVEFALASPPPELSELTTDVYGEAA
jgi:acetoin:2,6-dichlorophenolindophenol oxidoreductase subunit alpha